MKLAPYCAVSKTPRALRIKVKLSSHSRTVDQGSSIRGCRDNSLSTETGGRLSPTSKYKQDTHYPKENPSFYRDHSKAVNSHDLD